MKKQTMYIIGAVAIVAIVGIVYLFPTVQSPEITVKDGLILHLDATKITSIDGSQVAQWNDLSGSGNHVTQSEEEYRPYYRDSFVDFNGTGWLERGTTPLHERNGSTMFLVVKHNSYRLTASNHYVSFPNTQSTRGFGLTIWWPGSGAGIMGHTSGLRTTASTNARVGSWPQNHTTYVLTGFYDSSLSSHRLYENGILIDDQINSGPIQANYGTFYIGRFGDGTTTHSQPVDSQIGEVLVYDRALTDLEIDSVHTYLFEKWL